MAKFITTKRITAELEELIKKAEKAIFLVSYNFQIADEYLELIEDAAERNVKVHIAYWKGMDNQAIDRLHKLKNVSIKQLEHLHAKIYMNGKTCLVGSMNFSEASERNKNIECGVLLENPADFELYHDAANEVHRIFKKANTENFKTVTRNESGEGFCIRCKRSIPFNIDKPMCYECFHVWDFYGDPTYPESHCHFSGEQSKGGNNIEFPVLNKNWKKSQTLVKN